MLSRRRVHAAMEYAFDRFVQDVRATLMNRAGLSPESIDLVRPKPGIDADLAFPMFRLARERGMAPAQLALEIVAALDSGPDSLMGRIEAFGPFINVQVDPSRFANAVLDDVMRLGDLYGGDDLGNGQTTVVEYSSPNMARRMHVGHVRSTIIGQSLANILATLGYQVIRDNHIGDWGKNFGLLLTALQHEGIPPGEDREALAALEQYYTRYNRLAANDPSIDQEARDWSLRLEQGDVQACERWQWIVRLTMQVNSPMYDRLGVSFDTIHGESFYSDKMDEVVRLALEQGVVRPAEDGALVVDLPDLPTFLLRRSDGGTLYHTRDAATILFRMRAYQPQRMIYVVDARQELYFRQLFALVRAMHVVPDTTELTHVGFGVVTGTDGQPLAARRGNMIYLHTLLDEARERARSVVEEVSSGLSETEKAEIAEAVGVGAVIYNDLFQDARRNISLDWDRMLALQGNSAPYIQYMHARCRSILRRAAEERIDTRSETANASLLTHPSEAALIKQLAMLPNAVREAGKTLDPSVIAAWCFETARATASFYRDCPVLTAESHELRAARLRLVDANAQLLRNGLALLGIRAPERM